MAAIVKESCSVVSPETMQRIRGMLKESEPTHHQLEVRNALLARICLYMAEIARSTQSVDIL